MQLNREQTKYILNTVTERCPECGDRSWYLIDYAHSRKPTLGPSCPEDKEQCACAFIQCGDCGAEYNRFIPSLPA